VIYYIEWFPLRFFTYIDLATFSLYTECIWKICTNFGGDFNTAKQYTNFIWTWVRKRFLFELQPGKLLRVLTISTDIPNFGSYCCRATIYMPLYPLAVELRMWTGKNKHGHLMYRCVLVSPIGGGGRCVEEHAAVCPGRDSREVRLPDKRRLPRHSAESREHGGHLARPRDWDGGPSLSRASATPETRQYFRINFTSRLVGLALYRLGIPFTSGCAKMSGARKCVRIRLPDRSPLFTVTKSDQCTYYSAFLELSPSPNINMFVPET
jgi:hypothetical protein